MRGGGPRVTREDPVVMIVMSVRAASSEVALGVERRARERDPRVLCPPFSTTCCRSLTLSLSLSLSLPRSVI